MKEFHCLKSFTTQGLSHGICRIHVARVTCPETSKLLPPSAGPSISIPFWGWQSVWDLDKIVFQIFYFEFLRHSLMYIFEICQHNMFLCIYMIQFIDSLDSVILAEGPFEQEQYRKSRELWIFQKTPPMIPPMILVSFLNYLMGLEYLVKCDGSLSCRFLCQNNPDH